MRYPGIVAAVLVLASLCVAGCSGSGSSDEDEKQLQGKPPIIETPDGTVPPGERSGTPSRPATPPSQADENRG